MKHQPQQRYSAVVCGYEWKMVLRRKQLNISYYERTHPATIYHIEFSRNSDSPHVNQTASRQALAIFHTFRHMYNYIERYSEDGRRVKIDVTGYVTITHFKGQTLTKRTKTKVLQFDGRQMISKQALQQQKRIRGQIVDAKAQNTYLRETLQSLQKQHKQNTQAVIRLKIELVTKKHEYLGQLHRDTKMLQYQNQMRPQLYSHRASLRDLEQAINQMRQKIHEIRESLINQPTKKQSSPGLTSASLFEMVPQQVYGHKHWVVLDPCNKYLEGNYVIEGNTLHKIGQYSSYQVLGRDPFPQDRGRHYFNVFVERINWEIWSVGVCAQGRRNFPTSHQSRDCLSYFAKDGTIWQEGNSVGGGPCIRQGTQVRVVLDLGMRLIKWFMDGIEIGSARVSQHLVGIRLVPYVHLNYPGNRVTFNERRQDESLGPGGVGDKE